MPVTKTVICTLEAEKLQWFSDYTQLTITESIPTDADYIFYFAHNVMEIITPHGRHALTTTLPQDVHKHPLYRLLKRYMRPTSTIIDATAGLGKDSLITLYAQPQKLISYERETLLGYALVWLRHIHNDSCWTIQEKDALLAEEQADIWLIDPMFPEHPKTAKSQKRLQIIQSLSAFDEDVEALYTYALQKAEHVFVKNPKNKNNKNAYGLWAKLDQALLTSLLRS